ncbi:hypothetical protein HDV05_004841 [Chytridiales sp. JEL 0842]|nr:hypothetical protein HDV05_004841 [Chytridiales sp. JEL 0842]
MSTSFKSIKRPSSRSGTSTPTSNPDSTYSIFSNGSSNRTHSDVYNETRDLNTKLWEAAKKEGLERYEHGKRVEMFNKLYEESYDVLLRDQVLNHEILDDEIKDYVQFRQKNNNVQFPHGRSKDVQKDSLHELYHNGFNMRGLKPFLGPEEQLKVLKAREKELLVTRWKLFWEQVRPPRPGWHAMRGPEFHIEAERARKLVGSPELQYLSQQTRLAILDLWKNSMSDRVLSERFQRRPDHDDE